MTKIYAIEDGEYSDYHVVGVFSTKENAEKALAFVGGGSGNGTNIAEWDLDPNVDSINAGLSQYRVLMLKDGTTEEVCKLKLSTYSFDTEQAGLWKRTKAPYYQRNKPDVQDCLQATVWATDDKHAVKITNEIRTQWIATGKW